MNATAGFGFVVLGLSASVFGAAGGAYGLLSGRLGLLRTIRQWCWLVIAASVGAFVVMEVALFQRDYSLAYVAQVGGDETPALFNFQSARDRRLQAHSWHRVRRAAQALARARRDWPD
jgi:cytochrome c biogenesis factor